MAYLKSKPSWEKRIWSCDTEDDSQGTMKLVSFVDDAWSAFTFRRREDVIDFLGEQQGHLDIWCANLGYDLPNIFGDHLSALQITFSAGRVISARVVGTQVRFLCTFNHWKISVERMGDLVGLKKLKVTNFNNQKYCERDAMIVRKFVLSMKEKYDAIGCRLRSTVGSTALEFFKSRFAASVDSSAIPKKTIDWLFGGYYGGRTEVFFNRPIEGKIRYYDFRSMYPSVMRSGFYPRIDNFDSHGDWQRDCGIVEATVSVPRDQYIPYLPVRTKHGLIFPTGKIRARWTTFELCEAQKYGVEIQKIHSGVYFHGGMYRPFKDYVDHLWDWRMRADRASDELMSDNVKGLLNALYGKFAQKNVVTRMQPIDVEKLRGGDRLFGSMVLFDDVGEYPEQTNVIWSALTTAYGRDRVYKTLHQARDTGAQLLYCDTDSIVYCGGKPLKTGRGLGELKLEGEFSRAHFILPKLYSVESDKISIKKAKGVPSRHASEFLDKGFVEYERPRKLRESMARGLVPNEWILTKKEMRAQYTKRKVLPTGDTAPLFLR